ncbi:MAG TPA: immune inhibitor A domain-containing protein [Nocardioidaceae bacterium]|nr:immune inhibitor A domain-containing protein [Nocardioidaceae bacterium]
MNRTIVGGLASFALVAAASGAAVAAPSRSVSDPGDTRAASSRPDDLPNPLSDKQRSMRRTAVGQVIKGKATAQERNGSSVVQVGDDYVELRRKSTDKIFTMLAEFGDKVDPVYGGTSGPRHNQIAEPDRSVNNSTMWQADYSADHYRDMLFSSAPGANSLTNYYAKQSSGRYSVTGAVTDWVEVPYNAAYYGSNEAPEGDAATWKLIRDAAAKWNGDKTDMSQYDVWDRYDYDGDGNFNEPDGYIDHFQIVHAGQGEEEGGGAQGSDAIWSHRWYAYYTQYGKTGPTFNQAGGVEIPGTGLWVGDYTVEPENGGVAVFAHEFGHDLGLPDHYDTSYRGENSSAFWGLMSSGSWLGDDEIEGIGDKPNDMSAWDKLQLGWLNYVVADKKSSTIELGPSEYNTKKAQGIVVPLPNKTKTLELPTAPDGKAYWSTMGDDINTAMTLKSPLALPAGSSPTLDFSTWYDIEAGYDYVYVEASTDGGSSWQRLSNDLTGNDEGIDGSSGGAWVDTSFSLAPYAGQSVLLRLNYITDGGVALKGLLADDIKVSNGTSVLFDDGAGDGTNWSLSGFEVTNGTQTSSHPTYYIAENKGYRSYNSTLKSGPYNFGFLRTRPDWVEHFPYQEGLLISYWDESQMDNNVGEHPGEGLILPIDAHPQPMRWRDRSMMRTRIQVYDATFDVPGTTDQVTLSKNGVPTTFGGLPEVSRFSDSDPYWYASKPDAGVKLEPTGTAITVNGESGNVMNITVTRR